MGILERYNTLANNLIKKQGELAKLKIKENKTHEDVIKIGELEIEITDLRTGLGLIGLNIGVEND